MGGEDNGLTLQELAQRLEGLQHENAERLQTLERENAELRHKVATLEGSGTRRGEVAALRGSGTRREEVATLRGSDTRLDGESVSEFEGRVSRRSLLSKAGAAAVAAVAAGTLLNTRQAKANHFDDAEISADRLIAHYVESKALRVGDPAVVAYNTASGEGAVHGENSGSGAGVRGLGGTGVWGSSSTFGHSGVYGQHTGTGGYGVVGDGKGSGSGVLGRNRNATGVRGEGVIGVWGTSSTTGEAGVYAKHTGTGPGIVADGNGSAYAGVLGRNRAGTGVWGQTFTDGYGGVTGQHTGSSGYGVIGLGKGGGAGVLGRSDAGDGVRGESEIGYGGSFEGGKAQLMLKPGGSAGAPTAGFHHVKGEIYMDSAGTLFVCTADGIPGRWRKVTTTAV